jgi:hypothetical protein
LRLIDISDRVRAVVELRVHRGVAMALAITQLHLGGNLCDATQGGVGGGNNPWPTITLLCGSIIFATCMGFLGPQIPVGLRISLGLGGPPPVRRSSRCRLV